MSGSDFDPQSDQFNLQVIADRLADIESRLTTHDGPQAPFGFSDQKLGIIASSIYRARQRRLKHFDADLFGDPAWDMLLYLFTKQVVGERVSVTSLCGAARVPQATGLRWIDILISKELARKVRAQDDRRVSIIQLTHNGYCKVSSYVKEGIGKFDMPAPEPMPH